MNQPGVLPPGYWFTFLDLPGDVTQQEVAEYFASVMPIQLPLWHIRIEKMVSCRHSGFSKVTVSFTKEHVRDIVSWLTSQQTLRGSKMITLSRDRATAKLGDIAQISSAAAEPGK